MSVHNAVANRPLPRSTTVAPARTEQPSPPPGIAWSEKPGCGDSFTSAGPRRCTPDATIMPITTPDSAKSTPVLRYEAKKCRMELVSAAMRGDRRTTMELGQRLGQLKEALAARGAKMFPSSELSMSQYRDSFRSCSDEQMLGERSDQLQLMLVGEIQLDSSAVVNARERFGAVQAEIDQRGGCGLTGLDVIFAGWDDRQLTSAVTGMIDVAAGSGGHPNGYDLVGGKPPGGAPSDVHAAVPVGGQQQGGGFDLGGMLGNLFGGIFGGGGGGGAQGGQGGGFDLGNMLMGILDPAGLFKGLMGGGKPQQGQEQGGGIADRLFNVAGSGIMEMAQRGIGDLFQNLFK